MTVNRTSPVASYFGAQVRKHRIAAKLTMTQLASITGIDLSAISRLERGQRNPTPDIARRLDERAFPKLEGHFMELYEASRSWVPAAFRRWAEYEDQATRLLVWSPYTVHGLIQTRDYARVILSAAPGVTEDVVTARLNDRMNRQQRIIYREEPPHVWFVVDELSLYRRVGSAEIMTGQCARLVEVASLPHVTMTVMPAIEHTANKSGFIIGDGAAYAESEASGGVHTDQTVSDLLAQFGILQAESYRLADSVATIERVGAIWATGVSPLTAAATGETA
jgi:transcriptional regulator with XRE-family HTH domain